MPAYALKSKSCDEKNRNLFLSNGNFRFLGNFVEDREDSVGLVYPFYIVKNMVSMPEFDYSRRNSFFVSRGILSLSSIFEQYSMIDVFSYELNGRSIGKLGEYYRVYAVYTTEERFLELISKINKNFPFGYDYSRNSKFLLY